MLTRPSVGNIGKYAHRPRPPGHAWRARRVGDLKLFEPKAMYAFITVGDRGER
jgi:hypothetical protein